VGRRPRRAGAPAAGRALPPIETFSPRNHLHAFRLRAPAEVDEEVAAWLAEAYDVGMQRHL
jgi:hypothetical protein